MLTKTLIQTRMVGLQLPPMHPKQAEFYNRKERFVVCCAGTKAGKLLSIDSKVLTPIGWRTIGEIQIGDLVFSEDGSPTKVIDTTEVIHDEPCHAMEFSNGEIIRSGADHQWKITSCITNHSFICSSGQIYNNWHKRKEGYSIRMCPLYNPSNSTFVKINTIWTIESIPVKCISVEHPSKMFLVGESCIPTHNSHGGAIRIVRDLWNNEGWIIWWVAPVYKQCMIGWNEIIKYLPSSRHKQYKQDMIIELIKSDGRPYSRIEFKTAKEADTLRGFRLNEVLIDEADRISDAAFLSVYTTLGPTEGRAFIISTPKTRGGFFYREWLKGQKDSPQYDPHYYSMTMSTYDNPYMSRDVIEQARKNFPEDVFRTEYLAEWPSYDGGAVFRDYRECILRETGFKEPEPGHMYVMGVDLAKHTNFTVLTVIDKVTRTVVFWERFNNLDWKIQKEKIVQAAQKYNKAMVVMDTTRGSVGDVVIDDLRDTANFPIVGYAISSNPLKKALIDQLKMAFTNKTVFFPEIRQLLTELQMFEYQLSDHGVVTYAAPVGFNDDSVMSLALAVYGLEREPWLYRYKSVRGV